MFHKKDYHPTMDDFYVTPGTRRTFPHNTGRTKRERDNGKLARYIRRKAEKAAYNEKHS